MSRFYTEDTIVAPATAQGRAGIGVIRVSGPLCTQIAAVIAGVLPPERKAHYASFKNKHHELIDKGLILYFKDPHSFTGEDVLEFQLHGSPVLIDLMLQAIIECGARLARPGEFSERAFLNQKIDLTQAEAIADLIAAGSAVAARSALKSLEGVFSKQIRALVNKMIHLRMYVEAAIDFPEEEIDFLADPKVEKQLQEIENDFNTIFDAATQGVILQEGLTVALVGKPNVGKSSLLNYLTGQDTAIVTPIPGTTRDLLKEYIQIEGVPLHIVDTAGLRQTEDVVELEGMRRTQDIMNKAERMLWIIDATEEPIENLDDILKSIPVNIKDYSRITLMINKIDLTSETARKMNMSGMTVIYLSVKTGQGMEYLQEHLKSWVKVSEHEGGFIARRRHLEALEKSRQALIQARVVLKEQSAGELLAEDLKAAQEHLNEITGEFTSDDLLSKIFSEFCIGK